MSEALIFQQETIKGYTVYLAEVVGNTDSVIFKPQHADIPSFILVSHRRYTAFTAYAYGDSKTRDQSILHK